jgi:hypothetical protein
LLSNHRNGVICCIRVSPFLTLMGGTPPWGLPLLSLLFAIDAKIDVAKFVYLLGLRVNSSN